jgi:hypothetical protein
MKKIISLFQRNYETDHLVRNEVVPGAEWVLRGEGKATVKFDGTCCLYRGHKWFKRYDAKGGKKPPADFLPAQPEADPVSNHWPGWVLVRIDRAEDKWHVEAINEGRILNDIGWEGLFSGFSDAKEGQTYELIGPKIGGNPEKAEHHILVRHGAYIYSSLPNPLTFEALKSWLNDRNIEGLVWHHPDGRMVKIKKKDFGLPRERLPKDTSTL